MIVLYLQDRERSKIRVPIYALKLTLFRNFSSTLYLGVAYVSTVWRYFVGAMAHAAVIPGTLTAASWADVIAAAQGEGWIA